MSLLSKHQEAIQDFNTVLEIQPNLSTAHVNKGAFRA
jgi:hypothetical protein